MSLFRIPPQPIREPHQLQARDLLQSPIRWRRDAVDFLRAVINRADLNARETNKIRDLHGKAVTHG